jgi:hypothetical protein
MFSRIVQHPVEIIIHSVLVPMVKFAKCCLIPFNNLMHQLSIAGCLIFFAKYQFEDLVRMSQIKPMYEPTTTSGASVMRRKLKISSLNVSGSEEPPPLIRMKPKVSKLMISNKIKYFFFVKIMLFSILYTPKQKGSDFLQKKSGKRIFS